MQLFRTLLPFFFIAHISACASIKQESLKYPMKISVPHGAKSALEFKMKPRVPKTEKKGWMGIAMGEVSKHLMPVGAKSGEVGLRVEHVIGGSPAEESGLQEDDIIVAIDETPVKVGEGSSLSASFKRKIEEIGAETQTALTVLREEERIVLNITLGSPLTAEPFLKDHSEWEEPEKGPSLLEQTLAESGIRDDTERILANIRETSYEIGSYQTIFRNREINPFRLGEINYLLHFPMHGGKLAKEISQHVQKSLRERDLVEIFRTASDEIDVSIEIPVRKPENTLREFGEYIAEWKSLLLETEEKIKEAFSELTKEEIKFLFDSAPDVLRQELEEPMEEPSEEELREADDNLLKFLKYASKVDYQKLMSSFMGPVRLIDFDYFDYLKGLEDRVRELVGKYPLKAGLAGVTGKVLIDENFGEGRIIVGGPGNNTYTANASLIIDLGGDDIYLDSAGGSGENKSLSIIIDLSGNDTYRATEDFSQGSGRMGLGILIDLEGNDFYEAQNYSQGTGYFGLGILYDERGNDKYSGKTANQGTGFFGCGLLLDSEGDDSYHSLLYSQGFGMVKGFGAIVDGKGEDFYIAGKEYPDAREPGKAYQSLSQGFGFGLRPYKTTVGASGGIGLLSDGGGNDTYIASYFSQGAAYWYALGILADESGHDIYHARRYSQGTGIHRSIGVLWDREGDDQYFSPYGVSQGCGHDESIGILFDMDGNDLYQGGVLVQGAGNAEGLGILFDQKGIDTYYNKDHSEGWGDATGDNRSAGSLGLLMDLGGSRDSFSRDTENNSVLIEKKWGIRLDTEVLDNTQ